MKNQRKKKEVVGVYLSLDIRTAKAERWKEKGKIIAKGKSDGKEKKGKGSSHNKTKYEQITDEPDSGLVGGRGGGKVFVGRGDRRFYESSVGKKKRWERRRKGQFYVCV